MVKELKTVRQIVVDVTWERDDALAKVQAYEIALLEKERELDIMNKDSRRTKLRNLYLELEADKLRKRIKTAEADAYWCKAEYEETVRELEELRHAPEEHNSTIAELNQSLATSELELITLRHVEAASRQQLVEKQSLLDKADQVTNDAYTLRDRAIKGQRYAIEACIRADKELERACATEMAALQDRDTAREERDVVVREKDVAVREKDVARQRVKDLQQSLADVQQTQAMERRELALLYTQRDEAVRRVDVRCHCKLETQERGVETELQEHELPACVAVVGKENDTWWLA